MADNITIIRLEISDVEKSKTTNDTTPGNLSTTAAAAIGANSLISKESDPFEAMIKSTGGVITDEGSTGGIISGFMRYPTRLAQSGARAMSKNFIKAAMYTFDKLSIPLAWEGVNMYVRNMTPRQYKVAGVSAIGTIMSTTSVINQYRTIGYNLSGASHAAQMQQRKQSAINTVGSISAAAIINPWLAVGMVAHRAWQLSQQNRQELYQIKSSQIIASVMQERLVKDTIQRRF